MKKYDNIIIGFGKGGKTLAGKLAAAGERTALIERSEKMYGGTCINVACIPSKFLEHSAEKSAAAGGEFEEKAERYRKAVCRKRELTAGLRKKNYQKAVASGVEVITAEASFLDEHRLQVVYENGEREELYGEKIFINTGAAPFIPPIPGLRENSRMYTSEGMMELEELPRRLVIIGGGYIGLEFASYYINFGSQVTVIQDGEAFLPREDREVAGVVLEHLKRRGIRILCSAQVKEVQEGENQAFVRVQTSEGEEILAADAILAATGRRPNLEALKPENAGVALTKRGEVQTDSGLRTTVPHIRAMGDVAGGLQFTYISLDDSRIILSGLNGENRTTENRGAVPYSVFLDPPLSRVGMTEAEAGEAGYRVKTAVLPAAAIPKAQILGKTDGILKAVVDGETGRILGVHLYCAESHEMINLVKLAMDAGLPFTVLRDQIFTHPTMSEALNDLFGAIRE